MDEEGRLVLRIYEERNAKYQNSLDELEKVYSYRSIPIEQLGLKTKLFT